MGAVVFARGVRASTHRVIAGLVYEAEAGIVLDILSAQAALAQADLALATARFQQNLARISLAFAAGGSL